MPEGPSALTNAAFYCRRMEWRRRWLVRFRWEQGHDGIRERYAHTAAELRQLLDYGRGEPGIWRVVPPESQRYLHGDEPTACRNGHEYRTRGSLPTPHEWLTCVCGGHFWWGCRDCDDTRVEPAVGVDCDPRWPG